jgi:Na+/H+ antiporter NhaC
LGFNGYSSVEVVLPGVLVDNTTADVTLKNNGITVFEDTIIVNGEKKYVKINPGAEIQVPVKINGNTFVIKELSGKQIYKTNINPVPLWLSILPPLIAIILALLFKEVFSAIFAGIFSGTFIISLYSGGVSWIGALLDGFLAIPEYFTRVLTDTDHISIIVFSMLIGGTVNVISKNGGMKSIIGKLSKYASDRKSGQLISMIMGIVIFFDDYANTLVVGNTMRPLTDKLKISREKLSYIVDSTAAPVVSIAFITTWIGAELSYIKSGLEVLNMQESPYMVFMHSLKYAFYPVFTLVFMYFLIRTGKDFGPMYKAERKAIEKKSETVTENDDAKEEKKNSSIWLAIIPVAIIIFGTLAGLVYTGYSADIWNSKASWWMKVSETIGNSDSFKALMWASLFALIVAVAMSLYKKIFNLQEAVEVSLDGFKSMLQAIIILTLAWALALLTQQLHTADFFTSVFIYLSIPLFLIPAITFIISALISLSTGSSWGTMAILYPIMLTIR